MLIEKVERDVLNFVRSSPGCKRLKIYTYANSLVEKMHIEQLRGQREFGIWLNGLIDKNCESTYDTVTIKPDRVQMKPF